jgi:polyferredoxin
MLYTVLWSGVGIGLVVALFLREEIDVNVSPIRNPVYVTMSDGTIRNAYDLRLRNKEGDDRAFQLSITSEAQLTLRIEGVEGPSVMVPANETKTQRVFIEAAPGSPAAEAHSTPVRIWVEDPVSTARVHKDTVFSGQGD